MDAELYACALSFAYHVGQQHAIVKQPRNLDRFKHDALKLAYADGYASVRSVGEAFAEYERSKA